MKIEDKQKAMLADDLTAYINEKHNQDKCTGFIDGYNAALNKVKNLGLFSVRQQSELLFAFCTYLEETTNIKPFIYKDKIVNGFKGK